jgi:hypothetical protein
LKILKKSSVTENSEPTNDITEPYINITTVFNTFDTYSIVDIIKNLKADAIKYASKRFSKEFLKIITKKLKLISANLPKKGNMKNIFIILRNHNKLLLISLKVMKQIIFL